MKIVTRCSADCVDRERSQCTHNWRCRSLRCIWIWKSKSVIAVTEERTKVRGSHVTLVAGPGCRKVESIRRVVGGIHQHQDLLNTPGTAKSGAEVSRGRTSSCSVGGHRHEFGSGLFQVVEVEFKAPLPVECVACRKTCILAIRVNVSRVKERLLGGCQGLCAT